MVCFLFLQIDPPFEPARSPEGLEAKVLALRRQLEELRVLSANQERERLRQASDIRRLAEEVSPFTSIVDFRVTFSLIVSFMRRC